MFDKNSSVGQIMAQNPAAVDVLTKYGIPCYGHTENQLSSLEDVSIRYGVDMESMIKQINSFNNNTGLF